MELKSMTSEELANGNADLLSGQIHRKILNSFFLYGGFYTKFQRF
jgi:hypothetical protein